MPHPEQLKRTYSCFSITLLVALWALGTSTYALEEDYLNRIPLRLLTAEGLLLSEPQDLRISLWKIGQLQRGDVKEGHIDPSSPHYAGYQTELEAVPDSEGLVQIFPGSLPDFPEITPENFFLQVEMKSAGEPPSSYRLYPPLTSRGTPIDRFPLLQEGETVLGYVAQLPGVSRTTFTLDFNDVAEGSGSITLRFGNRMERTLSYDISLESFVFSADLRVEGDLEIEGSLRLGRSGGAWERLLWDTEDELFRLTDDLEIEGNFTGSGLMLRDIPDCLMLGTDWRGKLLCRKRRTSSP